MVMKIITCTAPVNIAVIKYWGKKDEKLIIPVNSSLSATLDQNIMRAKTTVMCGEDITEDCILLNGRKENINSERIQNVLKTIRRLSFEEDPSNELLRYKIKILSENNFPTAAGLASSAAGFACLANLFNLKCDISTIARQGSGSACRSVLGGWVAWDAGVDNETSKARQIADENHWSEMRVLILVVNSGVKSTGSTDGMARTVQTSELLKFRANELVNEKMKKMEEAILSKNFNTFSELTMKDSNQMHAVCLDTYPPISYMNDTSRYIQHLVHCINDSYGENIVAYTFDAGPNACLYILEKNVSIVVSIIQKAFSVNREFFIGLPIPENKIDINDNLLGRLKNFWRKFTINDVQYGIYTQVGSGPKLSTEHILEQ